MSLMHITRINPEVLRAALKRRGIWFVDLSGQPTTFYHRSCRFIFNQVWRKLVRNQVS